MLGRLIGFLIPRALAVLLLILGVTRPGPYQALRPVTELKSEYHVQLRREPRTN